MDFVLVLHSHVPWVLGHGRWPHGSDWLCEAALDTYLPLLEALRRLDADGVTAPVTIGVTPVLANQLAHRAFGEELEAFFAQRLTACDEAPASLRQTGDEALLPLVAFWRERFLRLRLLFRAIGGDLVGALTELARHGRVELISSAATHGFLPLLGRDESIRLQLLAGVTEHRRLFGTAPAGCWVPECAYRPRGPWTVRGPAGTVGGAVRRGIDEHLADAGYRYFFTDAHLAHAGTFLGGASDIPLGAERFDAERHDLVTARPAPAERTPYQAYLASERRRGAVAALVRDPRSSLQVWSRHQGYPGDVAYLEFHKIRWPGGLKYWRVTGPGTDLGHKQPYAPDAARERIGSHADHFAGVLGTIAGDANARVAVAPFDTELFGHWWFEGVDFLEALYRRLPRTGGVVARTASAHLADHPPRQAVRLASGSWGANGDWSMWLNDRTAWTWQRMWPLEDRFWSLAPDALRREEVRPVLAQAARALLLAQSSDWQFIISTGAAADYAERRFTHHCNDLERLLAGLPPEADAAARSRAGEEARAQGWRDSLFPNVLESVEAALA